jgi:hypothetical protein
LITSSLAGFVLAGDFCVSSGFLWRTGPYHLAVIATATGLVFFIPLVTSTHHLAVLSLIGDPEVDEKPRQTLTQLCPPAIGIPRIVE